MAEAKHTDPTAQEGAPLRRELRISIRPMRLNFWEYEGTRAQLEAEGVIPSGTAWPDGGQSVEWEIGRVRFGLRRCRPEWLKGPMRLWVTGDWWCLRGQLRNGPDYLRSQIIDKERELQALMFQHSATGRRQWHEQWNRFQAAQRDARFQAFKALVPGLLPPPRKPRRKARPSAN